MPESKSKKVAIIGGGCAGIAAAFDLTRPERNGEFDVTVYQLGWRLGGKGASGRDARTGRIEEHGLHLWMGFYENAFRLMRECYAELDRPEGHPIRDWQDAFKPDNFVGVTERDAHSQWTNWAAYFPPAAGQPGDPLQSSNPFTVQGYLARCAYLLHTLIASVQDHYPEPVDPDARDDLSFALSRLIGALREAVSGEPKELATRSLGYGQLALNALVLEALGLVRKVCDAAPGATLDKILPVLDRLSGFAQVRLDDLIAQSDELRRVWEIVDVVLAIMRGVLRDGLLFARDGFEAIDDYDWRDWLEKHGCGKAALDSAFIRGSYDLLFAFENGDVTKPRLAAGQALRGAMRMFFTYRGALFWKMQSGMGDIVFAPFYDVLKARGVKFEFFHCLTNVGLARDKSHVRTLAFDVQAKVKGGAAYDPLIDVNGLRCWPSLPRYEQLVGGAARKKAHWNPEHGYDAAKAGKTVLRVGEDFDFVVLAVGLGAVEQTAAELIKAEPAWADMVANVKCVATQAFQVWLNTPVEKLGWSLPPINISAYVEPFDTWADMRQLIPSENWRTDPKAIAYFCSVLPDSIADGPSPNAVVRQNAIDFLDKDVAHFWPGAVTEAGFRWPLLHAQGRAARGETRFNTQFWTANIAPTDRYVLSLPGSLKYRISPLDNRFDNLTIAGDWTDCGHQAGCVEAAVMSGLLAACALSGDPEPGEIVGYDHP